MTDGLVAACMGKKSFPTPADARRAIRPRLKGLVEPYRCRWCGQWHNGSARRDRKRMGMLRKVEETEL